MKIDDSRLIEGFKQVVQGQQIQHPAQEQGAKEASLKGQGIAADNVNLSSKARQYQKVKKAVMEAPDIRQEKVEHIRSLIAAGTYNVRGEEVAAKIIQDSLIDTLL